MQEADTILPRFAHPDYAAATDVDSGTADIVQRIEPILECSRGDDIAVIFRAGIDIMVIIIEAGIGQLPRLFSRQHAQRHAGFHAHGADTLHHLDNFRSEEHTSELPSLMRIPYAVFCLKKKNTIIDNSKQY